VTRRRRRRKREKREKSKKNKEKKSPFFSVPEMCIKFAVVGFSSRELKRRDH
jgi:hypothetical protein